MIAILCHNDVILQFSLQGNVVAFAHLNYLSSCKICFWSFENIRLLMCVMCLYSLFVQSSYIVSFNTHTHTHTHTHTDQVATDGGLGSGSAAQASPFKPQFRPDDLNVQSLAGLAQHLQINTQVCM